MRIISGIYGRRRFDVPSSFSARPTTDFAKENLFNVIVNRMELEGTDALDLFSGTGSISFELVSRGCREKGFDFIFADPPYALPELPDVPKIVLERGLLRPGGLFVMEHPKEYDFSNLPGFEERRVYGSVNFSLFVREEERTDA